MTDQSPEKILLSGVEFCMNNYPLESYFEMYGIKKPIPQFMMSSCWRGYRGEWSIVDKKLFLNKLRFLGESEDAIQKLFGTDLPQNGVFADWFSGYLKLEKRSLSASDDPLASKSEVLLEIERGLLQEPGTLNLDEHKKRKIIPETGPEELVEEYRSRIQSILKNLR